MTSLPSATSLGQKPIHISRCPSTIKDESPALNLSASPLPNLKLDSWLFKSPNSSSIRVFTPHFPQFLQSFLMEAPAIRQRMTLSDQLSVLQSSSNLRDHLRFPDDAAVSAASRGRNGSVTLATVLEAEKISAAAAAASSTSLGGRGGRTLLDVIREEEDSQSDGGGSPRWRDLTDRLRIRPSATWADGSASTSARPEGIRVSLMTLMEMREREEEREEERRLAAAMAAAELDGGGDDDVAVSHACCVCMARKKGAAFIPCGHTFCRACSRELFMGRGNCPLCNGPIVEVLDIF